MTLQSRRAAQSTLTQHYELEERKEQTNEHHVDHIANLVLHLVASVAYQVGIHLTPLDSTDLRLLLDIILHGNDSNSRTNKQA